MSESMNTNKILRRISYPRLSSKSEKKDAKMSLPIRDPQPIDADRVFKMTYDSRDFRNSDISAGSVNVMNSLKEKLAEKSAAGSISGVSSATPSRVHAMLNDQLGNVEHDHEMRFYSEQTKTVPSKVFQALQHSYPGVDERQPISPKGYHALKPNEKDDDDNDVYERFIGNPTNTVPSKVFQALQYNYGAGGGEIPYNAKYRDADDARSFSDRQTHHIPSRSFQMLNRQYSTERDQKANAPFSDDLQHALDLLERELDAMTTAKNNVPANPIITVPLHKGVHRNQRVSEDLSPNDNPKLQVPFDKRKIPGPEYQSHIQQEPAPPVPVRVDSKKFQYSARGPQATETKNEASVAKYHPAIARDLHNRRSLNNDDCEIMVAPVAHTENVVAYSAEFETPWMNAKNEKPKGHRSLIIKPKSSSRNFQLGHVDSRDDSRDSISSLSSIQDRIPDFDPETYIITTKPPSVSSHGVRSDSSESGHSLSSYSSNAEPRHDEEEGTTIVPSEIKNTESAQQVFAPRKMVINVNGKARISEGEKNTNAEESDRMQSHALDSLYEANRRDANSLQECNDVFTDETKIIPKKFESSLENREYQAYESIGSKADEIETSKLQDLTLERMASEEVNEVFEDSNEQAMKFEEMKSPVQSRINVKSVARRSGQSQSEHPKSPPVSIQMSRNSHRRSIQLDQSMKYDDDHPVSKSSQPTVNRYCPNNSHSSSATSQRRSPIRDESFIVASEVKDSNEMSEERLKEAFEVINATADRILDQIDRVGSFNNNEEDSGGYYSYGHRSDKQTPTESPSVNGMQRWDQNENESYAKEFFTNFSSSTRETNSAKMLKRTEISPIRISNKPTIESSSCQASSSGVRITLPAFNIKVASSQNASRGERKSEK